MRKANAAYTHTDQDFYAARSTPRTRQALRLGRSHDQDGRCVGRPLLLECSRGAHGRERRASRVAVRVDGPQGKARARGVRKGRAPPRVRDGQSPLPSGGRRRSLSVTAFGANGMWANLEPPRSRCGDETKCVRNSSCEVPVRETRWDPGEAGEPSGDNAREAPVTEREWPEAEAGGGISALSALLRKVRGRRHLSEGPALPLVSPGLSSGPMGRWPQRTQHETRAHARGPSSGCVLCSSTREADSHTRRVPRLTQTPTRGFWKFTPTTNSDDNPQAKKERVVNARGKRVTDKTSRP